MATKPMSEPIVELSDSAAAYTGFRYGRVMQDDGDSVFVSGKPDREDRWFIEKTDILANQYDSELTRRKCNP